jgi:hypothetical protein
VALTTSISGCSLAPLTPSWIGLITSRSGPALGHRRLRGAHDGSAASALATDDLVAHAPEPDGPRLLATDDLVVSLTTRQWLVRLRPYDPGRAHHEHSGPAPGH